MKSIQNKKEFKVAIIHHSADMDGLFSGSLASIVFEIIKSKLQKECNIDYDIIGYNYGKDSSIDTWLNINIANQYDYIQFIDITPPEFWLDIINEDLNFFNKTQIDIFDHHKSAFEIIKSKFPLIYNHINFNYYFDSEYCASYIYFVNLFASKNRWFDKLITTKVLFSKSFIRRFEVNKLISVIKSDINLLLNTKNNNNLLKIVDLYDTWKWKNNQKEPILEALYLNEYICQYKSDDIILGISILLEKSPEHNLNIILGKGKLISEYKKLLSEKQKHLLIKFEESENSPKNNEYFILINDKANSYSIEKIENIKFKAICQPLSGPNHDTNLEKYISVVAIIFYNDMDIPNNKMNISVRGIFKQFDCNLFVKWLTNNNGGGHFSAAGGSLTYNQFFNLIDKNQNG